MPPESLIAASTYRRGAAKCNQRGIDLQAGEVPGGEWGEDRAHLSEPAAGGALAGELSTARRPSSPPGTVGRPTLRQLALPRSSMRATTSR